ncbi:MAG: RrF2 family transcriptional regulator [Candidatus Nanopelagicales bacterium]
MHISARADYGMRALLELVEGAGRDPAMLIKGDALAEAQQVPIKFLEAILRDLRLHGIVESRRGIEGGYRLAKPASQITVADVIRALDGPLAAVRGQRPETLEYSGPASHLRDVWIAARVAIRSALEAVTLQQVADGDLPLPITELLQAPGAWERRG